MYHAGVGGNQIAGMRILGNEHGRLNNRIIELEATGRLSWLS